MGKSSFKDYVLLFLKIGLYIMLFLLFLLMAHSDSWQHRAVTWLKDPWHVALVLIIIFGILLRIKYYNVNTGVWWDEGEYLAKAKNWAFGTVMPNNYWTARPVTLTLLWALLLKLGGSVTLIRFLTELLPSVGTLVMMYLLGKEMYNKKVGVIATAMISVFWLHVFFTARLLMDLPGLFFSLVTIYCFWKGFVKHQGAKYIYLTIIFFLLTALTKYNDGVIILPFLLILLIKDRLSFLKNKVLWIATGLCLTLIFVPYLLFNYLSFGDALPALTTYILNAKTSAIQQFEAPAYYVFGYFQQFLLDFWFWFFIASLLLLWRLLFSLDLLVKRKNLDSLNDLFCVFLIAFPMIFFVFVYKFAVHQYLFLMTPALFLLMARGTVEIDHFLSKYHKYLGIAAIVLILVIGGYAQLKHGVGLIENKKDTYKELRDAGLWIKKHTGPAEPVMLTSNQMEFGVFAERRIVSEGDNLSHFEEHLTDERPQYLVLSLMSDNPNYPWLLPLLNDHQDRFMPVQAWFADAQRKQPRVVIFKVVAFEDKNAPSITL